MWRQVYRSHNILKLKNVRHFLSDSYKCSEAWQSRFSSPILQNIRPDLFYHDLERKFQQRGKVCAIDIDIFVNALKDNSMLSELSDIIHKLRLTAETSNALDSTSHAVIRHHLDHSDNNMENLLYILDDRLSYGIFLDAYTANLCLDKMIKLKKYQMAAKVATFLMLQENFENPLNRTLSLYACYKYLEDPQPFEEIFKQPEPEEIPEATPIVVDPKAKKVKRKEKKEEIRIRINWLRNPYFDDHLDIRNSHHLVGKTFLLISSYLNGPIGNSVRLLGYCYYEKYADGAKFIESIKNSNDLYKDVVKIAHEKLAQITDRDNDESFQQFRNEVNKLAESSETFKTDSFEDVLHKLATDTAKQQENSEIEEQKKIYDLWNKIRETKLQEELDRVDRYNRIQQIETIVEEMKDQEEKLWFFENEDKIDLELEKRTQDEVKEEKISRRQQKLIDDAYVPPEVDAKRNQFSH